MATLRKIHGRYYAYFYDRTRQPKSKSVALRVSLKSAAEKMLRRLEHEYADGSFDPWSPVKAQAVLTYKEASARFLESRSNLREQTIITYDVMLKSFETRLAPGTSLVGISEDDLTRFIQTDTSVAVATRRKRYRHLKAFFRWCVKVGLLPADPLLEIKPPKASARVAEFLTVEDLERLLLTIDADFEMQQTTPGRTPEVAWLRDLIQLAVCTGLRRGELLSLRWGAVDFESGFLSVRNTEEFQTKSGHERRVPIVGDALAVLQRLHAERGGDGLVIVRKSGRPIPPRYLSKRFKHYVRLAKLPEYIRFHSLRHTCASWLVMRGVPLPIVKEILGHSSIQVTERYSHLAPNVMTAAMKLAFEPADPGVKTNDA